MVGIELLQAPVVKKVGNTIHWINHYSLDNEICFSYTYSLDGDLSGGNSARQRWIKQGQM